MQLQFMPSSSCLLSFPISYISRLALTFLQNGEIYIYPPASSVTFIGKENLIGYPFLSPDSLHSFCKVCGTSVCVQALKEDEDLLPLNLRTMMSGVNVKDLNITEYDGAKNDPQYVVS